MIQNRVSNFWGTPDDSSTGDLTSACRIDDSQNVDAWIGPSSKSVVNTLQCDADQPAGSEDSTTPKMIIMSNFMKLPRLMVCLEETCLLATQTAMKKLPRRSRHHKRHVVLQSLMIQ